MFALYGLGLLILGLALSVRGRPPARPVSALARGLSHGEVAPQVPLLDAEDAMANAAVLNAALVAVPHPNLGEHGDRCQARARTFAVMLNGQLSRVRFGAHSVCQLVLLKQISAAQPGYGERGLAEVAAFVLGRRLAGGADVDVTRIVVPPFRFTGDTVTFQPANLGELLADEQFIGTYHTHPDGDLMQGVLSETDLEYMHSGFVDFAGAVGALGGQSTRLDWLFDIVDPKLGEWNVYAHDTQRLKELRTRCQSQSPCPVNELRIPGSAYNLYSHVYEERDDDWAVSRLNSRACARSTWAASGPLSSMTRRQPRPLALGPPPPDSPRFSEDPMPFPSSRPRPSRKPTPPAPTPTRR